MTNSNQYRSLLTQDRLGLRLCARLSDATDGLPRDVLERLRAGRVQAVSQRRVVRPQSATQVVLVGGTSLAFGTDRLGWWGRLGAALPMLALVLGLIVIGVIQNDRRADEIAEIDTALLTDELPPAAYADPGFLQFLKLMTGQNSQ